MSADAPGRAHIHLVWNIAAPPARVFRAWTDPAHLSWFFNDAMPIPPEPIEVDLRVGGAWRQMMVQDAATRYFTGGIYREIVANKKLVFAWGAVGGWPLLDPAKLDDAPRVALLFNAAGAGTELIFDMDLPESMAAEAMKTGMFDKMREGWSVTVGRLVGKIGLAR